MVLDRIPQSLPVHLFGSRPQPPTSRHGIPSLSLRILCREPILTICTFSFDSSAFHLCIRACYSMCSQCADRTRKNVRESILSFRSRAVFLLPRILVRCQCVCLQHLSVPHRIVRQTQPKTRQLRTWGFRCLRETRKCAQFFVSF